MQNLQYNGESIRLTLHALSYTERRGFTADEIEIAIKTGKWERSEKERLQCSVNFPYEKDWNG